MQRLITLLIFLLLTSCLPAQNAAHKPFALVAKWAPLSLTDPYSPTMQPGVGITWNNRWGLHAEYGVHFNPFNMVRSSNKDELNTRRFRAELRYYPEKTNSRDKYGSLFAAVEGFGVAQSYRRFFGRFVAPGSRNEIFFDTATIHRNIAGVSLKGGYEAFLGKRKRFLLEASGGAGMRQVGIRHADFNVVETQPGGWLNAFAEAFRFRRNDEWEGNRVKPHLSGTIRIGYRIF